MKRIEIDSVGYKVRLFPTKEQEKIFYEYFGMSRFVYNLCIDLQEEHYEKYKKSKEYSGNKIYKRLSYESLTSIFTNLRKDKKYSWLKKYSVDSMRGAIRDCCKAYSFYDTNSIHYRHPNYKSRIYSKKQFSVRNDTVTIDNMYIQLPSIGKIKYCNSYGDSIIGTGFKNSKSRKYIQIYNPRVSFDGLYFYLSFSIIKDNTHQINSYWNYSNNEEWQDQEYSEAIGIDVGLKREKWMVDSIGNKVERPDNSALNKKISRLRRKYSRQKKVYSSKSSSYQEQHPNGSKNMQKTLAKINKCFKKITNRRKNVVHEYACSLLKKKPKAIVMENISSESIISNHKYLNLNKNKLNQMTYEAALYESMMIIENKMTNNGIKVVRADNNYPSSQLCSCCGYRQNIGKAKYYRCPNCGTIIDRDLNAAINLAKLAY